MASEAITVALAAYPDCEISACVQSLQEHIQLSPPASPILSSRRIKGTNRRHQPWPMPRALFLVDQRRVPAGRRAAPGKKVKAYTADTFVDEYGPEKAVKAWNDAQPEADSDSDEEQIRVFVLLLRTIVKDIPEGDPAVGALVARLLEYLPTVETTNAEGHKTSVAPRPLAAACLTQLAAALGPAVGDVIATLKQRAAAAETTVMRRMAAMGLAALLKGLGLSSIKQYEILPYMQALISDTKNGNGRQGAVFILECLFRLFGYPFEPYIFKLAPFLISCFDASGPVRWAAERCSLVIFGNISHFAVRSLLPMLLEATKHKSWRVKASAAMCLGATARCARRALAVSLPLVVPELAEMVSDSNPQVTKAAADSLEKITEAITNPEVLAITPKLLAALENPKAHTKEAIGCLMHTSFIHPIDPASLSLLMPIVHWGLKDRAADTQRAAVQVIGSACSLVKEDKHLLPYMAGLLPPLQTLILDSIPETRLFASKSIGMLIHRFGECEADDLIPWLMTRIETSSNQIEQDGAGQCLAEVLSVLGITRFNDLLPQLRTKLGNSSPKVREGFMGFFLHIPVKFPEDLAPYAYELCQIVFNGMIDSAYPVQGSALQLGINLMQMYYHKAEQLLLPSIEDGLLDDRFKESAITLLGYLLARCAGVYELNLQPDEMQASDVAVNKVSTAQGLQIAEELGKERRDYLLSVLCLHRFDANPSVSDMAGRVLRSICENLKKDQEDIYPVTFALVLKNLFKESDSRQPVHEMAAKNLGSMVSMFFDKVMGEIIPLCLKITEDCNEGHHLGALLGCKHLAINAHKTKIAPFYEDFFTILLAGLVSDKDVVRAEATELFYALRKAFMGAKMDAHDKIIEDTGKALLAAVEADNKGAVDGLRRLAVVKGLKSEKKEDVWKWLEPYMKENPAKGPLAEEMATVLEEGKKLHAKQVVKLNAKAEAQAKDQAKLDKANAKVEKDRMKAEKDGARKKKTDALKNKEKEKKYQEAKKSQKSANKRDYF